MFCFLTAVTLSVSSIRTTATVTSLTLAGTVTSAWRSRDAPVDVTAWSSFWTSIRTSTLRRCRKAQVRVSSFTRRSACRSRQTRAFSRRPARSPPSACDRYWAQIKKNKSSLKYITRKTIYGNVSINLKIHEHQKDEKSHHDRIMLLWRHVFGCTWHVRVYMYMLILYVRQCSLF